MVVPPTEQLGGPAPGGNGGGDEVLVSVRVEREEVCAIHPAPDEWMQEMILYKKHGNTPNDSTRARKVVAMAPSYQIIDDNLFKLSFGGPRRRAGGTLFIISSLTSINE
nr:uncharacterized protein LOC109147193 [Ipomoea batatas]